MSEIALDEFQEIEVQPEKHISNSQVGSYMRCSMILYWRYEKNVKSPPSSAISFGVGIHKALETNFKQKIYSKKDLPVDMVTDIFRDTWKEAAKITVFDPEKNENPDEMLDEGTSMISKYQSEISPTIQPSVVETKFSIRLPGVSREVIGYIDLIDDKEVVIDHKTSRRTPDALTLAKDGQLTLYKVGYRAKYGHDPRGLRYDYMVRRSSKKTGNWVEIHQMQVERNAAQERCMAATFKTVSQAISLKQYFTNPTSFMCSPVACGYWSRCQGKILAGEPTPFLDEIHQMQADAYRKMIQEGK